MTDGLAAVQSRIAELQTMLGLRSPSGTAGATSASSTSSASSASSASSTSSTSSSDFASALRSALTDGTLGLDAATGSAGAAGAGAAAGAGSTRGGSDAGTRAVTLAASYSGVPYRWGGEDPSTGLDCSGLTQLVYGQLGVSLPRVAADQARTGTAVASLEEAAPGDLVFFGTPVHHVGIYTGDGMMIDAPRAGKLVGEHPVWGEPTAIRRVTAGANSSVAGTGSLDGPYAAQFVAAGSRYGVDPALLSAVAKAESGYQPKAVSSAGAQGLMQLMPSTARSLGVDPYDPDQAIDGAARLISGLLEDFGGRTDLALAGYNAGAGAVRRYGGVPPYAETQTYVRRVTQYQEALR